ncbi:INPP5F [Cordylochernes scorpioides]|uniref:INPP5F n=1 Tax=Cordylochernes scorpioides TaxID=51811 RepID=A0ABY6LJU2_9ARAC|nr:INPP5F [Cordylochernes scorpioides]
MYGGHEVFKIQKVALVPILPGSDLSEVELDVCPFHPCGQYQCSSSPSSSRRTTDSTSLQKTWTNIKSATTARRALLRGPGSQEYCLPSLLILGLGDAVRGGTNLVRAYTDQAWRVEREFLRMFNDTSSFYYSLTGDITTSLQRQHKHPCKNVPLWRRVDDRFFWNKHMLSDLIECEDPLADHWILPIIQGFVQIEHCVLDASIMDLSPTDSSITSFSSLPDKEYTMMLVSRRSRFRAGTRYKRRGVDENGKVANYVETEQIFMHGPHVVSFVQVRGSVPIFWSQPGSRYRPPPRLDRTEAETKEAFSKHFEDELGIYDSQVIVSLVEQNGRERVICQSYLKHVIEYNSPNLTYVSFDFHDYCRGMRFENVSVLIESIKDIIKSMKYCWIDQHGMILEQNGVFRVNCIDCLDRTNIVQTALAKAVMDTQFIKLGLLPPEGDLPVTCRRIFQILWANNGDIISRQYAGTAALKVGGFLGLDTSSNFGVVTEGLDLGDFTRTGERKISGVMKDGYNSASRYYMNRFKDEFRQLTIDLMLGNVVTEDMTNLSPDKDELPEFDPENSERVRLLIEDTKRILVPDNDPVIGGWALIDADPVSGDPNQTEMDTILILTQDRYYVVEYDEQTDRVTSYEKVLLEDLEKIELGPEPSLFKSKHTIMRLHYQVLGQSGYFHSFRNANFRFFNNIVVPIKTDEQAAAGRRVVTEALKVICDTFIFALSNRSFNVPFFQGKLERRKSKVIQCTSSSHCPPTGANHPTRLLGLELPTMPRNISDGQLVSLRSAGTRAFSNMTSHIARFNPMKTFKRNNHQAPVPPPSTLPVQSFYNVDSSSESEEEEEEEEEEEVQKGSQQELSENSESEEGPAGTSMHDTVLESCGILATSSSEALPPSTGPRPRVDVDDFVLESMRKNSDRRLQNFVSGDCPRPNSLRPYIEQDTMGLHLEPPEIHICTDALTPTASSPKESLLHIRGLSKSSEELDRTAPPPFSSSDVSHLLVQEEMAPPVDSDGLSAKMKTSHSESAIQDYSFSLPSPLLSSPIAIKKDLVLSPLSRIAKGVQNLGLNLRHSPSASSSRRNSPEDVTPISEEQRRNCLTRIIEI